MASQELETFAKYERYYNAGGVRTRCFEKGEGESVILLHGAGGHAETWVRNLIPLAEKFRVLAIDYLGHGFTDKPKTTYNLPNFSKHLLDFMDAAGVKKAHLVGESQGGQISVLTASEHPERVNRLALIVGGIPSNEHGYTAGLTQLQELTREATGTPTKETIRKRMEWFLRNRRDLARQISYMEMGGESPLTFRLLAIPSRERLARVLRYLLDPNEFLSPYGIRSLSRIHLDRPFVLRVDGEGKITGSKRCWIAS
jgi:pimeloyl-ACP methyl ester carboxylesterase